MFRIYECVASEHDARILVLALLLCFFASSTAIIMAQRALAADRRHQLMWLAAAGVVTGIGIWSTHFSAMLAFEPGGEIRFNSSFMLAAFAVAVVFSVAGWIFGFQGEARRPLVGGGLIGLGIAGSHYIDTFGIRFAGNLSLDVDLVIVSLLVGIPFSLLAAQLLARHKRPGIPITASLVLAVAIFGLHLTSMAALTLTPDPSVEIPPDGLGLESIGGWVIAGAFSILAAGFSLAVHDRYSAGVIAKDRQRLQETLKALVQSKAHYRSTLELNPQIPWTTDPQGRCLEIGPKWSEYLGLPIEAALGSGWLSVIHPDDAAAVKQLWNDALRAGTPFDARYRLMCHDGSFHWFRDRGRPRRDGDGTILKWYGSLEDIHEQVIAEEGLRESEERYRLASRATEDVIWDWRHSSERLDWGGAIDSHFGYHEALKGTSLAWWAERVHPEDRDAVLESLNAAIAGPDSHWSREYRFRKADGTFAHILSRGYIVRNADGQALRSIGAMMDITESKQTEASLRWAAQHDPLTDLPNRSLFREQLAAAIADAESRAAEVGLVILDVDQFKLFNDTRGHNAGDRMLSWIAHGLLKSADSAGVSVARLGGDEFAIILPDFNHKDIHDVLRPLREPFSIDGETINVSVSAGLGIWPQDATCVEGLLKCADLALYACKTDRQDGIRQFKPEMKIAADQRVTMLELAVSALRENRISAYYQPKVCLKTGTLIGMEALLRWQHPTDGLQSPGTIAAAFENAELAVNITDRMLNCVLRDARLWLQQGLNFGRIAVNASAADFMRGDFAQRVLEKLKQARLSPQHFELEVTENVLVGRDANRVAAMLRELNQAGMTIALDDFGTGYASLAHLNSFPVDVLKIDQSFVSMLSAQHRAADEAIVRAIIGLARNLRIHTVAEGVETREQSIRLQELRCDAGQGYLFSRPVAPSSVATMLTQGLLHWPAVVRPRSSYAKVTA